MARQPGGAEHEAARACGLKKPRVVLCLLYLVKYLLLCVSKEVTERPQMWKEFI